MELFEVAVKGVKVIDPANEASEMGPLITAAQRESVASYVEEENIAFRGSAPEGRGYWFPPTVLETPSRASRAYNEEIFGPVVSVVRFADEHDAVAIANDSPYGLSGSIWSRDIGKALRVARGVETGALSVNSNSSVRYSTPFGGFKRSGIGRELGPDALLGFSEEKNVFLSTEE
jgi:acyl-CoA reductase-like NAD-dependent aldehyde dehydrogenase